MSRTIRQIFYSGITVSVATFLLHACYAQEIVSTTTVSPFYTPPTTSGIPVAAPVDPLLAQPILQTQMLQGTPGAVTIPSTGVILPQSGTIISQPIATQPVMVQKTIMQPETDFEWTFSRIRNSGLHATHRVNTVTGAVTTTFQPEETTSLLPWLHRREVTRLRPVTVNVPVSVATPVVSGYSVPISSSVIPTTVIRDVADTVPMFPSTPISGTQVTSYPIQQVGIQSQQVIGSATILPFSDSNSTVPAPTSIMQPMQTAPVTESQQMQRPISEEKNKTDQQKMDLPASSTTTPPRVSPRQNPLTKENGKINLSPKMLN